MVLIGDSDTKKTNMKRSKFSPHIPHICHRRHGRRTCNFFLADVNFYRFNAKNWQFTVYFAVITQKIGNLLCILS